MSLKVVLEAVESRCLSLTGMFQKNHQIVHTHYLEKKWKMKKNCSEICLQFNDAAFCYKHEAISNPQHNKKKSFFISHVQNITLRNVFCTPSSDVANCQYIIAKHASADGFTR